MNPLALRQCVHNLRCCRSSLALFGAKQAEEQLARLSDLSAEKRRVEKGAEKLKADAEKASAGWLFHYGSLRFDGVPTAVAHSSHGLDGKQTGELDE